MHVAEPGRAKHHRIGQRRGNRPCPVVSHSASRCSASCFTPAARAADSHRRPDRPAADPPGPRSAAGPIESPTSFIDTLPRARERTAAPPGDLSGACRREADPAGSQRRRLPVPAADRCRTATANAASRSRRHLKSPPCGHAQSAVSPAAVRYSTPLAVSCPASSANTTLVACAPVMIVRLARCSGSPSRKA